ncbi:hypothetical protein P692DRAFT_20868356 [Suillus brevipes Sb2]|nr:hypothetical protein P692DRAFT_20868356 [Suillus brevipes Sb2]
MPLLTRFAQLSSFDSQDAVAPLSRVITQLQDDTYLASIKQFAEMLNESMRSSEGETKHVILSRLILLQSQYGAPPFNTYPTPLPLPLIHNPTHLPHHPKLNHTSSTINNPTQTLAQPPRVTSPAPSRYANQSYTSSSNVQAYPQHQQSTYASASDGGYNPPPPPPSHHQPSSSNTSKVVLEASSPSRFFTTPSDSPLAKRRSLIKSSACSTCATPTLPSQTMSLTTAGGTHLVVMTLTTVSSTTLHKTLVLSVAYGLLASVPSAPFSSATLSLESNWSSSLSIKLMGHSLRLARFRSQFVSLLCEDHLRLSLAHIGLIYEDDDFDNESGLHMYLEDPDEVVMDTEKIQASELGDGVVHQVLNVDFKLSSLAVIASLHQRTVTG